ncbi:MAG TPA: EmrA/EmrK family multidrug efflux transporter periplasmic adaptor subunit, partial [Rhodanobacter sp.]|nr:EmrA/EmrK family multidrug efflux transporter periplasmic adaptor subunit [Rhodanobacter sp.]
MSSQTLPDSSDAAGTPGAAPAKKNPRGLLLRLLGGAMLLAAVGWALWYFLDGRWYEGTDDAYVNGNVVQITPQVPGTVVSIGADDGDLV